MARKKASTDRERLAASLFASLPDSGADYQVSSAFAAPERRRLLGVWAVQDHRVGDTPWIETFAANALRGTPLASPVYAALYDFRESVCVKKVVVSGLAGLPDGDEEYSYRMSMAISWQLGRGCIVVRPELGYQSTSLGGVPVAVKEFEASGGEMRLAYRFEGELLILEEGQDRKVLRRVDA